MVDVSWDRLQVHVNGWGGHFVDPADPTRFVMDESPSLAAFEWLRARMWDDHVLAGPLDVQRMGTHQAFLAGRLAMVEDGSWALKDVLTAAKFRVGVAPFPAGPVRRATLATTDGFGIYSGSRYRDAAWSLLQYLVGPEFGSEMARTHLLQPARASLVEEWVRDVREQFPAAAELDVAAFAHGHVNHYSVVAEILENNMADAKSISYQVWDRVFTLGLTSVDEIRTASRQLRERQLAGR